MQRSPLYTILFATVVCIACAIVVSSSAVALKERQDVNAALEKQRNVLKAAGLLASGETVDAAEIEARFSAVQSVVIDLATGAVASDIDPTTFDQGDEAKDPAASQAAPPNPALVRRLPNHALVYELRGDNGQLEKVVLPIEGKGLWSTLYGFITLEADLDTIGGITFYEHKETPGLGGEVDNPRWQDRWVGRQAFGDAGEPKIAVKKGRAGDPESDPYQVDGLSGATLTSRGVTNMVQFWLGENGFSPYLERLKEGGTA